MSVNCGLKNDIVNHLKNCEFRELCDNYFTEQFSWTIKGTSILSRTYTDKEVFFNKVINRLSAVLQSTDWQMHILNTYSDDDTLIVEMRGEVKANNGEDYNNDYCWIVTTYPLKSSFALIAI